MPDDVNVYPPKETENIEEGNGSTNTTCGYPLLVCINGVHSPLPDGCKLDESILPEYSATDSSGDTVEEVLEDAFGAPLFTLVTIA